jgi:hypothetical protein
MAGYGLYLTTTSPFSQPQGETLTITGNEFIEQTINALITNYWFMTFSENDVQSSSNDMTAAFVEFNVDVHIHKNKFLLTGTNTTAVVLEGSDGRSLAIPSVLANNFVVAATGFELNSGAHSIDMYFNTIVATTLPITVAFNNQVASSDLNLRNNILFNIGAGPAISVADGVLFEDSNYNNFIKVSGALIDWQSSSYFSVDAFNAATGFDERSTFNLVLFTDRNNADLHLAAGSIGDLSLTGTPIVSIPDDYDFETRSLFSPYMGADEASITLINEYSVGGTVSGLEAGNNVVIHNSNGDSLNISSDDVFAFPIFQQDGTAYEVTVFTQPTTPTQFCSVTNGSGVLAGSNVTNIAVSCQSDTYSVGGTTTGLAPGTSVGLKLNGGTELELTTNGVFNFPTGLFESDGYAVTVSTQPTNPYQVCTLGNNNGTIATSDITNLTVTCVTESYSIGGNLSGLEPGNSIALKNNNGTSLILTANDPFTFPDELDDGEDYNVTIFTQPDSPVQSCAATNASGTLSGQNITNVTITCNPPDGPDEIFADSFE